MGEERWEGGNGGEFGERTVGNGERVVGIGGREDDLGGERWELGEKMENWGK